MLRFDNDPQRPLLPRQKSAYERLRALGELDRWQPDILFKIFLDLDTLLFTGILKHNVALRWCVEPHTSAVGYTSYVGRRFQGVPAQRTAISINVPFIVSKEYSIHDVTTVLIHEMCHAILMVCCADSVQKKKQQLDVATVDRMLSSSDISHALAFEQVMATVQGRLGLTRFACMTKGGNDFRGTVSKASALGKYWKVAGGFRRGRTGVRDQVDEFILFDESREQSKALWDTEGKARKV